MEMSAYNYTIGFAYIALPNDIERDVYIADCYKNYQVSIVMEDGGFFNRVPISPEDIGFIRFPDTPDKMGTPVVFGTDGIYKQPAVLTRLPERAELGDGREYQFKFKRKFNDQLVEISGSAANGQINIIANGASSPAKLNISVMSDNQDSEVDLDVAGSIRASATGDIFLNSQNTANIATIDPNSDNETSFQQTTTEHHFLNEKLIVNKGEDPLTLGNELADLLNDFIDQVAAIKTVTSLGLQPIVNKASVQALKKRVDSIKSQVMFTDK